MAVSRHLPYLACHFQVRWSPGEQPPAGSGFSEVLLPTLDAGGGRDAAAAGAPGAAGAAGVSAAAVGAASGSDDTRLVLRRGFTGSLEIYRWWNETRLGIDKGGRTVEVALLDGERGEAVCTWVFANARPERLGYSPLQALEAGVLVESLTLGFDSMTMK